MTHRINEGYERVMLRWPKIMARLAEGYDATVREKLPDDFTRLLDKLK